MKKYLKLDPKPSDLTMIRVIKGPNGLKSRDERLKSPGKEKLFYESTNCGNTLK
jgi:hypothetical protein